MTTAGLVLAAGKSSRFEGARPKQFEKLLGVEILVRSVRIFHDCPFVFRVLVVVDPFEYDRSLKLLSSHGITGVDLTIGGQTRQESCMKGLLALEASGIERVLIHDAARPLFKQEYLESIMSQVCRGTGVVVSRPVTDTLYRRDNHSVELIDRTKLWHAETPQCFHYDDILCAHKQALRDGFKTATDDAQLFLAAGGKISLFHYRHSNIKITEQADLLQAEALLKTT